MKKLVSVFDLGNGRVLVRQELGNGCLSLLKGLVKI
jgi:hypothetical protein